MIAVEYTLYCQDSPKKYTVQTGVSFKVPYKEHMQAIFEALSVVILKFEYVGLFGLPCLISDVSNDHNAFVLSETLLGRLYPEDERTTIL